MSLPPHGSSDPSLPDLTLPDSHAIGAAIRELVAPPTSFEVVARAAEVRVSGSQERRMERWHRRAPSPRLLRLREWYAGIDRRHQTRVDIAFALFSPLVVGYLLYLPLAWFFPVVVEAWFWVIIGALVATSLIIGVECARATRFPEPPATEDLPDAQLPRLAVVVAAYLPNEADTILDSLATHLAVDYPHDKHLVVLAYNTPEDLPEIENRLGELALREPRFLPLRVHGSTSKVHNVNAALDHLRGLVDVVAFFDADHHPAPTAPRRAARWLADAAGPERYDVVQGQCVVRNVDDSFVARTVAAEFATIYAVSHPGRTVFNDFGIFGGSNGWWRAETIEQIGMDDDMLTEDIDASCRALAAGARLGTDPRIVSTELAPTTWSALWRQRMRWSQGWWQVSLRHLRPLSTNRRISGSQRRGVALLFGWRVVHPWIATQMVPLILAQLTLPNRPVMHFDLLLFVFTSAIVLGIPFLQGLVANRVAPPGLRGRPLLFARYSILSAFGYSEFKATVTRAAVLRELVGAHSWDVTTRARPTTRSRRRLRRPAPQLAVAGLPRTDLDTELAR